MFMLNYVQALGVAALWVAAFPWTSEAASGGILEKAVEAKQPEDDARADEDKILGLLDAGDFSQPAPFYAERIARLGRYRAQCRELPVGQRIAAAIEKLQDEQSQVLTGKSRIGTVWYDLDDWGEAQLDRGAVEFIGKIKSSGGETYRLMIFEAKKFESSHHYPDIIDSLVAGAPLAIREEVAARSKNAAGTGITRTDNAVDDKVLGAAILGLLTPFYCPGSASPLGGKGGQKIQDLWYPWEAQKISLSGTIRKYAPDPVGFYLPLDARTMLLLASCETAYYRPVLDRLRSVRAAFLENPGEVQRQADLLETIRPQWPECNLFALTYRMMYRGVLAEVCAQMKSREWPVAEVGTKLSFLESALPRTGSWWAEKQTPKLREIRKQFEAGRIQREKEEVSKQFAEGEAGRYAQSVRQVTEELMASGSTGQALVLLANQESKMSQLSAQTRQMAFRALSDLAFQLFLNFRDRGDSGSAQKALSSAMSFWRKNPAFDEYVADTPNAFPSMLATRRYQMLAREFAFLRIILGDGEAYQRQAQDVAEKALSCATTDFQTLALADALRGYDFAKRLWPETRGLFSFAATLWGGMGLAGLGAAWLLFKLLDGTIKTIRRHTKKYFVVPPGTASSDVVLAVALAIELNKLQNVMFVETNDSETIRHYAGEPDALILGVGGRCSGNMLNYIPSGAGFSPVAGRYPISRMVLRRFRSLVPKTAIGLETFLKFDDGASIAAFCAAHDFSSAAALTRKQIARPLLAGQPLNEAGFTEPSANGNEGSSTPPTP